MRILHLLKHCYRGNGHVHVAVDLACTQADLGHHVVVATGPGTYHALLRRHGVEVVDLPVGGGTRSVTSVRTLLGHVRRVRPDVIHAHMMTSAVLGFAVSKLVRVPMITTVHNSFDRHSVLMRLGTVIVAVSEAEHRQLLAGGYPAGRTTTVLNGATNSPREELQDDLPTAFPQPCVATLSGLHHRKAVGDVIIAFAEVAQDFPNWHLNVIGDGPDRERLQSVVSKLHLDDRVHFVGATLTPRPLLERTSIFASASLAEPFGLNIAEARSAGCAVVATAIGGIPEVLDHGRAGRLVPSSSPKVMAGAFRDLMADDSLLKEWQNRAVDGVEKFTVRRMTDDYLKVYASAEDCGARRRKWTHRFST